MKTDQRLTNDLRHRLPRWRWVLPVLLFAVLALALAFPCAPVSMAQSQATTAPGRATPGPGRPQPGPGRDTPQPPTVLPGTSMPGGAPGGAATPSALPVSGGIVGADITWLLAGAALMISGVALSLMRSRRSR